MKKDLIESALVVSFVLTLALSMSFFLPGEITGHGTDGYIEASITQRTNLEVTAFTFFNPITIYDVQNITVEITNTGSTDYDASITETIFNLTNGTALNQLAQYVDSTVHLYPGNTRGHKTIFVPYGPGSYFIKATARYGSRIKEVWGSFTVTNGTEEEEPPGEGNETPPSNVSNETNQTPPGPGEPPPSEGGGGGGGGGGEPMFGEGNGTKGKGTGTGDGEPTEIEPEIVEEEQLSLIPNVSMKLEYPERIVVYRNITNLFSIKINNNGKNTLTNVMMYTSYPDVFDVDLNPKYPQAVGPSNALTFVVSAFTENASLREYVFEFDVVSQEMKSNGSIIFDVRESPETLKELVELKLMNYKFLVSEISAEIETASIRGLNVTVPLNFIMSAINGINRADEFYNNQSYASAFDELTKVESDIKNAVFTLGNLSLKFYAVKRTDYIVLIFLIPIALLVITIYYRKRRERRPRLLLNRKEE